jgi:predicted Zn finger-like uncharacterized protein
MPVGGAAVSLVTRCPNCSTSFRATQAQLQARGGQVRCGRCGIVFDARAERFSDTTLPPSLPGPHGDVPATLPPGGEATFDFGPAPRRRYGRVWWPACALALLALLAQGAYRYRGDIVLALPQAKPLIQNLCTQIGCDVPLPRRIELISIESSDLQGDSVTPSVMVLTATLRNRAAYVQALPALELSLTDPQDRTVARRVLLPRDYAPKGTRTESGFGAGGELQVRVYIEAAALKASGYRLYLFYP